MTCPVWIVAEVNGIARFVFKLQSLLNLKRQMEDSQKNELAKATRRLEEEKSALLSLEGEMTARIDEFNESTVRGVAVSKLKEYNSYISVLAERIAEQKENVNYAMEIVDKVRDELIKVVQEREILEKLREKKYLAYLEEEKKDEQRLNDEIVSYRRSSVITGDKNGQGQ